MLDQAHYSSWYPNRLHAPAVFAAQLSGMFMINNSIVVMTHIIPSSHKYAQQKRYTIVVYDIACVIYCMYLAKCRDYLNSKINMVTI